MAESDVKKPVDELAARQAALERTYLAGQAVKAAARKRERAERLRFLDTEVSVYIAGALDGAKRRGEDPERIARLQQDLRQTSADMVAVNDEWKHAEEEERQALEELAESERRFGELTVEPRVEAAKLEFEEHKLRATLSSASIVGVAATVGILLPENTSQVWLLGIAFVCLFVSTVLGLEAMKSTTAHVQSVMIRGNLRQRGRLQGLLVRHTFTTGLAVFALFVLLNLPPIGS